MVKAPVILSEEFLAQYADKTPFENPFAEFVYLRTYSRWLDELFRRETWIETVKRCAEYSMELYQGPKTHAELLKEAEQLFDDFFWINQLPSGRTLWVGGTDIVREIPTANYNCSFTVMNKLKAFHDLFYLLMVGCGVGFSVEKKYVDELPLFKKGVVLDIKDYEWCGCPASPEETVVDYDSIDGWEVAKMTIGDSREGWSNGLLKFLELFSAGLDDEVQVDVDGVRPQGARLKKFGGKASGPGPYVAMLKKIHDIIENAPEADGAPGWAKLRPIDVLDICNIIGQNVVAGGVRRTAEVALFDADDAETLHAKDNYWLDARTQHRSMSNNSVMFWEKPSLDYLMALKETIANSYEPGFVNALAASLRRPWFGGFNPCVEILLAPEGFCNLATVFVTACLAETTEGPAIDFDKLARLIRQATRHTMRITNVRIELDGWREVQWRDRLLGVNLTGCEDAFDAAVVENPNFEVNSADDKRIIRLVYGGQVHEWNIDTVKGIANAQAQQEASEYAHEMRIPRPLLVTTIQPSGTLSQLRVCSSGFHKSFAPYYIRRVRINAFDALAKTVKQQGYKIYPEVFKGWKGLEEMFRAYIEVTTGKNPETDNMTSQDFDLLDEFAQDAVLANADTWVVEFVVKTNAKEKAADEPALDQLSRYFSYQKNWTDHNTSATIQVGNDEWDGLFEKLHERWDDYIGVSFQNKSNDKYDLAPYEAITQEVYEERITKCPKIDVNLLNAIENGKNSADDDLDAGCSTGACPVR